jgi:hypothetical protein
MDMNALETYKIWYNFLLVHKNQNTSAEIAQEASPNGQDASNNSNLDGSIRNTKASTETMMNISAQSKQGSFLNHRHATNFHPVSLFFTIPKPTACPTCI